MGNFRETLNGQCLEHEDPACPVSPLLEAISYVAGLMILEGASYLEPDAHNPGCGCGHLVMVRLYCHVIVGREVRGTISLQRHL